MRLRLRSVSNRSLFTLFVLAILPIAIATLLISCGGFVGGTSSGGTGNITVSMTDPPSCKVPNGSFQHVYITIRSVQAHTSATADDNSSGWVELAPQLNTSPMQVDLFSLNSSSGACLLATLGSTSLPAGTYQQIRLLLVPNTGATVTPSGTNNCGSEGFNCVVLQDGTPHELQLSSQANTGLKIPPGQIAGGPISVAAGQSVDLNIDFNACASIIQEGNGMFRLKPVLKAEQVSTNTTGITGQVLDASTNKPVSGTVIVALESPDSTGTDTVFIQENTDSAGNFTFCPLPAGATFDVVVVAINSAGIAYNATVAVGVPGGTSLGTIPLTPETGTTPTTAGPATFQGIVTATTGTAAVSIDALVSAIQTVPLSGSATLPVTIPAEATATTPSATNLSVDSPTSCPTTAPAHTNCAQYTLIVPASNPMVGVFASGKISFTAPASGDVLYSIRADAFLPMDGGTTDCMPSSVTVTKDSMGNPLKALPGPAITPKEIDFTGCM